MKFAPCWLSEPFRALPRVRFFPPLFAFLPQDTERSTSKKCTCCSATASKGGPLAGTPADESASGHHFVNVKSSKMRLAKCNDH